MAAVEDPRLARDRQVWLVRSRRALVVAAGGVNALALAVFLGVSSGGSALDTWPLWLVLVGIPLALLPVARFRAFRPIAVVLGLVSLAVGVAVSLVAPAFFLIPSGMALAAAGLVRAGRPQT